MCEQKDYTMDDSSTHQLQLGSGLTYDDEAHAYALCGKPVPSVTAIISAVMNAWKKPNYPAGVGEKGRLVHLACELDDINDLDDDSLDPALAGYVRAWRAWKSDHSPRWIGIEARVASVAHAYAGTFDRLAVIRNRVTLIDIKSGRPRPEHALQTAAYAIAYEEMTRDAGGPSDSGVTVDERACVYINGDGSWSAQYHGSPHDRAAFLGARALYRWKENV
jgi:hypothetical protein